MLAPTLAPGDIVLLDNLRSHKVAGIAEAGAAREAQLIYLPPYSPDLNPIEHAFAKYKALLRKAAERTVESLWEAIGRLADLFSPAECRNFFNQCRLRNLIGNRSSVALYWDRLWESLAALGGSSRARLGVFARVFGCRRRIARRDRWRDG